jgi:hypothetical protein
MTFVSKQDLWLKLLLIATVVGEAAGGAAILIYGPERWPGFVLLAAAAFVAWLMRSTYYIVDESVLIVRCGPFRWTIGLGEIESITPTRNPLSSPALSLDRFWISYRRRGRKRAIMISPLDKDGFLAAVTQRAGRALQG